MGAPGPCQPVVPAEEDRQSRRAELVAERLASAERQFQVRQREGRIDGEKRPRGVDRLEHGCRAALPAQAVADDLQQLRRLGRFANRDADGVVVTGECRELPRLGQVLLQQAEIFGRLERGATAGGMVAAGENRPAKRGQDEIGREIGGQRRHPAERVQRAGHLDEIRSFRRGQRLQQPVNPGAAFARCLQRRQGGLGLLRIAVRQGGNRDPAAQLGSGPGIFRPDRGQRRQICLDSSRVAVAI